VLTPIKLYPLYCRLYHCTLTLTRQQPHALFALSPAFVSDIFFQLLQCTLYWLQLNKCFSLLISLRNQQTFFHTHSFCWKLAVATTALNFWTCTRCPYFHQLPVFIPSMGTATEVGPLTSSPPGQGQSSGGALWTPAYTPSDNQTSRVYSNNPVLHLYISCYVTVNKLVLLYLSLHLLPQSI
jgi:hypothetical protein